jgi:hypothetical protein
MTYFAPTKFNKKKSFEETSTSTNAIEKKIWPRKRKFAQQSKIKNKR